MEEQSIRPGDLASKIARRFRQPDDKNVVKRKFVDVARVLWPDNTAAHLAAIGGKDERTGQRWLRGEGEPPAAVLIACLQEMLRPQT